MRTAQGLLLSVAASALFFSGYALPRVNPTALSEASFASRGAKIEALVSQLESLATSSQEEVNKLIVQESAGSEPPFSSSQSFWISNQVSFKGASFALVEKLSALPSVGEIREEFVASAPKPTVSKNVTAVSNVFPEVANGVEFIDADRAWGSGYGGQGVVVGSISTGVFREHESLSQNWRSSYGWFDPVNSTASPVDENGYGTHAMASTVGRTNKGSKAIGVAPGATWIACRACLDDYFVESDVLACAQFMTCPTDPEGNNRDCSKAPRVVINAWGWYVSASDTTSITAAIDVWRAAGIIPIFPNSDNGAECVSAQASADSPNVISVGASYFTIVPTFSSRGPASNGVVKPDFAAPGMRIETAGIVSVDELVIVDRTELAASHVAGVVALLISKDLSLSYGDVYKLLAKSVSRNIESQAPQSCGDIAVKAFPNNYAARRVDALGAMKLLVPFPTTPGLCAGLKDEKCYYKYGCQFGDNYNCVPIVTATTAPTPAPTPAPGQCGGLSSPQCERVFFCTWNASSQTCLRWWK